MYRRRRVGLSTIVFRVVLSGIGLLTVVQASHVLRYALCGLLLAILVGQWLVTRRQ